jgi:hypothetical protein
MGSQESQVLYFLGRPEVMVYQMPGRIIVIAVHLFVKNWRRPGTDADIQFPETSVVRKCRQDRVRSLW